MPVASRPTRSSTVKRLPRRRYEARSPPRDNAFLAPDASDRRDARLAQTEALDEIERVLDEMNRDVEALPFDDDVDGEDEREYKEANSVYGAVAATPRRGRDRSAASTRLAQLYSKA